VPRSSRRLRRTERTPFSAGLIRSAPSGYRSGEATCLRQHPVKRLELRICITANSLSLSDAAPSSCAYFDESASLHGVQTSTPKDGCGGAIFTLFFERYEEATLRPPPVLTITLHEPRSSATTHSLCRSL
jgi:hypothetical protein